MSGNAELSFYVQVEASDKGTPKLSNRTRVTLTGNAKPSNVKENKPPVISVDIPIIHVAEADGIGQKLALIEAEDPDGDTLWFDVIGETKQFICHEGCSL